MNFEHLCMGCMGDKGDAQVCAMCGWVEGTPPELPVQLAPRTMLGEKYLLGRVLGQGGFGITYLAWDLLLNRKLAIKEYFPREICSRGRDDLSLQPLSQRSQHDYEYGLAKFVEEGRNLARFRDYPGIVSLLDFFEANGTAYIVMAYMEGMTFKQYLEEQGGKITFDQTLTILNPVMDALREVHRTGMLHRDISPDNIYLNRDRQVKILDFGATRYAMRDQSQNLTVMIKPGYAPLEQYSSGGKQGPWTDVYAIGATFYRALSGRPPSEAPDRLAQDDLVPPSRLSISIPPPSESALMKALAVQWKSRFQSMEDFQKSVIPRDQEVIVAGQTSGAGSRSPVLLAVAGVLLLTTLAFAGLWLSARSQLKSAEARIEELQQAGQNQPEDTQDVTQLKKQVRDLTAERARLQDRLQAGENGRDASRNQGASPTQQRQQVQPAPPVAPAPVATPAPAAHRQAQSGPLVTPAPVVVARAPAAETPRLSLAYFELYSSDGAGSTVGASSTSFSGSNLRYVLCRVGGPNPLLKMNELSTSIEVRFFAPGGGAPRVVTAQVKAPKAESIWVSQALLGNGQSFQHGQWRVEVWSGQNRIGEKTFQVN